MWAYKQAYNKVAEAAINAAFKCQIQLDIDGFELESPK